MTRNELTDMILDTKRALTFYESIKTDCNGCVHLGASNKCFMYDAIVPEEHIAQGCDNWEFDDVPF